MVKSAFIKFNHISKTFPNDEKGKKPIYAINDVSLNVYQGEIFGLVGYSGAGKSTLLRMINGLETPTNGSVIVSNQNISKFNHKELNNYRHKIGIIFQGYNLLNTATVYKNVYLPLKLENIPKSHIKQRVEKYLKLVNLWDRRNSYPKQLSGGQKQRVAIARALSNEPNILLSDESTSALDPDTTRSILNLLKEINNKLNITIFLVTHELDVVKEICDNVGFIDNGKLIETDNTLKMFATPKNELTKQFLVSDDYSEIPKQIIQNESKNKKLLELKFLNNTATSPIIAELSQEFNVKPNILAGTIDYLKGKPFGRLLISLEYNPKHYEKEINYIKEQNIIVREINNL